MTNQISTLTNQISTFTDQMSPGPPDTPDTAGANLFLDDASLDLLLTANARDKAQAAVKLYESWQKGAFHWRLDAQPPDRPARPERPQLMLPGKMPKRRKGGTKANRVALLHALAHIELNAIDLAFDIILRFGGTMPLAFTEDWLKVGYDEGRHFLALEDRLSGLDSHYGALPAHDGLWQSALDTKDDLPARLAVVPMVLEARGLDVTPCMINRFEESKDKQTADILQMIYEDEITHVKAGTIWFSYLAKKQDKNETDWFQDLVRAYFKGQLKPPFNIEARNKAGMSVDFYQPLTEFL